MRLLSRPLSRRRGSILPLIVLLMASLLTMAAFAIDYGWLVMVRTELQLTADAASTAGAKKLPYSADVVPFAQRYANYNHPNQGNVLDGKDVIVGNWDSQTATFTAGATPANAVKVIVRRTAAQGNPVNLYFARVAGFNTADITAEAIAVGIPGNPGTRFLIDDEVIDTDEPWISPLKTRFPNTPVEDFISDKDGDFFIDLWKWLPADNKQIVVRTGQVGDEGLMDILANEGTELPKYPFGAATLPFKHTDFLNIDETPNDAGQLWRGLLFQAMKNTINPKTGKGFLDPLSGVGRFNDPNEYTPLPNRDYIHVSPVYKSDISALDSVGYPAVNGVNAQGDRRGLFAFKILGIQSDPRGGQYLPNMLIEVINPIGVPVDSVVPANNTVQRLVK